jgi:hypothetical protein
MRPLPLLARLYRETRAKALDPPVSPWPRPGERPRRGRAATYHDARLGAAELLADVDAQLAWIIVSAWPRAAQLLPTAVRPRQPAPPTPAGLTPEPLPAAHGGARARALAIGRIEAAIATADPNQLSQLAYALAALNRARQAEPGEETPAHDPDAEELTAYEHETEEVKAAFRALARALDNAERARKAKKAREAHTPRARPPCAQDPEDEDRDPTALN